MRTRIAAQAKGWGIVGLALFMLLAGLLAAPSSIYGATTISGLPEETAPASDEWMVIEDATTTKKATLANIAANMPAIDAPSVTLDAGTAAAPSLQGPDGQGLSFGSSTIDFNIGAAQEMSLSATALNLKDNILYGSAAASGDLILESTSHATKGYIYLRPVNGEEGITVLANGAVTLYYDNAVALATSGAGAVQVGTNDTQRGLIALRGHATGSTDGGQINLYAAADHDTTIDYYEIKAYQDDLYIGPTTNPGMLKLTAEGEMVAPLPAAKSVTLAASSQVQHITADDYHVTTAKDADSNEHTYTLRKDAAAYQYVQFPIAAAENGTTAPGTLTTITSTHTTAVRKFAGDQSEDVTIYWEVPDNLSGSTIWVRVSWYVTEATAPSSEGVSFDIAAASVGSGDALGAALGTVAEVDQTGLSGAQYTHYKTSWVEVTPADLAAGETCIINVLRDHDDAADDYAQDIGVAAIEVRYLAVR